MNNFSHEYVLETLPQRYPFLMVDRILEADLSSRIKCIKNVSANEPCFQGHFPNKKIFPGVYVIEAMAQSSILLFSLIKDPSEKVEALPLLYHSNVKFKKVIVPGDQMIISVSIVKRIKNAAIVEAEVKVHDKKCANGELTFTFKGDE